LAGTAAGLDVLAGAGNNWADAKDEDIDENINEAAIVVIATLIPDQRAGIDVTSLETRKSGCCIPLLDGQRDLSAVA
jgi:hypothetical protein